MQYELWIGSEGETAGFVATAAEAAAWLAARKAAPVRTEITAAKAWYGWSGPNGESDRVVVDAE